MVSGIFDDNRYFDITAEYAKASPEDLCLRLHIANRGPETAAIDVLPTLWLRNTWRWVGEHPPGQLTRTGDGIIELNHGTFGRRWLYCDHSGGRAPELLFTENETNRQRVFSTANDTPYVKDAFHRYIVHGEHAAVNPRATGTKAAAHYHLRIAAGKTATLQLRFIDRQFQAPFDPTFAQLFSQRQREADEFYQALTPELNDQDVRTIQRQALAALLWTKQYYEYDVERWLQGDPAEPPPPAARLHGRNSGWRAFKAKNVISMPDKWEFPWFASWDWAFHCVVFSLIDPAFAKSQLLLPFSPTYLNPNGQVPAYEWGFEQVNPPIQAWATLKVYGNDKRATGKGDQPFLKTMFHGLERNFDWWQSCEDSQCRGLYAGGFLGLDDIAVFNRNLALPTGGHLQQSDGTAWAAMFALALVEITLELACEDKTYVPKALHYLEKFLEIAKAMNYIGKDGHLALWDEQDGFYFSALVFPDGREELLKVYSLVGLAPLFATQTVEPQVQQLVPDFFEGMESLRQRRPDLFQNVASTTALGQEKRTLFAIAKPEQLRKILAHLLNEDGFLSPYGIRAVSRIHQKHPYVLNDKGHSYSISYQPAESQTDDFGGNSNWRGPIWVPMNFLLIKSMQRYYRYFGDDFKVECPTGSGKLMTLKEIAQELSRRLIDLYRRQPDGKRAVYAGYDKFQNDPHWRDLFLFHEVLPWRYRHGAGGESADRLDRAARPADP